MIPYSWYAKELVSFPFLVIGLLSIVVFLDEKVDVKVHAHQL